MANKPLSGFLDGLRVLDLTDEKGIFAGKLLADYGADVIQVERPGGSPARQLGPFYHDERDPEKSLFWFAHSVNKRGITLDIEKPEGRQILKDLVKTSHFLLESFDPGYMDRLGLGYADLSKINPGLVMTSITPFGNLPQFKGWKGPDIVIWALSGYMYITGDPDRAPLRVGCPQAYFLASERAVAGTMFAHYHQLVTGEGQHVDVNAVGSMWNIGLNAVPFWVVGQKILKRAGSQRTGLSTSATQRQTWPCKDGFVTFSVYGGDLAARNIPALLDWIESEGMADANHATLRKIEWRTFDVAGATQEIFDIMAACFGEFYKTHTKTELYDGAFKRGIMLYPAYSPKEILKDEQLQFRKYWVKLEHPELGESITYPGPAIRMSESPCSVRRKPPLIGEHNREIYSGEMGLDIAKLKKQGII